MNNKFLIILIGLLFIVSSVSALTINTTTTENSILIIFDPPRLQDHPDEVYFNNVEITTPIDDRLLISELKPSTEYSLVVSYPSTHPQEPSQMYHFNVSTAEATSTTSDLAYYLSTFGLIIVILVILALSTKIPYAGYVGALLAFGVMLHGIRTEADFIMILVYVILFFVSMVFAASQRVK